MKEYEYKMTSIVIKDVGNIAKNLTERFNEEGREGWQLVQWEFGTSSLSPVSMLTVAEPMVLVLATFKKERT